MTDFKTINFKDEVWASEDSPILLEIEIEKARLEGIKGLKILHGYGSHGVGGKTCQEIRKYLRSKKSKLGIKNYFNGDIWNISNEQVFEFVTSCKDAAQDCDLNHQNPGITIIVI